MIGNIQPTCMCTLCSLQVNRKSSYGASEVVSLVCKVACMQCNECFVHDSSRLVV